MSRLVDGSGKQTEPTLKCFLVIVVLISAAIVWSVLRLAWAAPKIVAAWDLFG